MRAPILCHLHSNIPARFPYAHYARRALLVMCVCAHAVYCKVHGPCRWGHATTQSNQWLPAGFDDFWGPLLCLTLILVAVTADAFLLQPLQLCMRSPVMPVWNGTLKQLLSPRTSRLITRLFGLPDDRFKHARPPLPEHYQRTMFRVDKRVNEVKQRRLEKFGQEQGGDVIRTDAGVWYLRMENEPLLEIVFDVRSRRGVRGKHWLWQPLAVATIGRGKHWPLRLLAEVLATHSGACF